jgi:hypothetical protein
MNRIQSAYTPQPTSLDVDPATSTGQAPSSGLRIGSTNATPGPGYVRSEGNPKEDRAMFNRRHLATIFPLGALLFLGAIQAPARTPPPVPSGFKAAAADDANSAWSKAGSNEPLRQAFVRQMYSLENSGNGTWHGVNRGHRLTMEFSGQEARLSHPDGSVSIQLAGYGYGDRLTRPALSMLSANGNRVEYQRGGLVEWYVNGPDGLEQGFTLGQSPRTARRGDEPLVIAISVRGDLVPIQKPGEDSVLFEAGTSAVLRYAGMKAADARGRTLPSRLQVQGAVIRLIVEDRGAQYPLIVDPLWTQQQELTASDGAEADDFGVSVSVSGDTAIIGSFNKRFGSHTGQGAAYVFVRSGEVWTQQQELTAADGATGDYFGSSVAVGGNIAVVGAVRKTVGSNVQQGAVYVFERNGAVWTQQQKLTAADGAAYDGFGGSVSVSGETAAIGASGKEVGSNPVQGAAYVFVRSGATWTQQQELTAANGAVGDRFGTSVSVSMDSAVVGAPSRTVGSNGYQGAAYVFVRSAGVWSQQQELTAANGAAGDYFGWSVSVSENTAVIGAYLKTIGSNAAQGAAFVFVSTGGVWTQQQELTAANGSPNDVFGGSVSVSGNAAVIGSDLKTIGSNRYQGAAYVFLRSGDEWYEQEILSTDGAAGDNFGSSVSVSGETAVIGAWHKTLGSNTWQGAAYVFVY